MFQRPDDNICSYPEGLLPFILRIAVDFGVVPAVTGIRLIGVVDAEATVIEQAESLRWFAIVLVNFGKAIRKIEMAMIEPIREREFLKILLRENSL